jgi:DNA adenine methylase
MISANQLDSETAVNSAKTAASCRPVLRWAGSKLKLLPLLETYWKAGHNKYVEPFVGSACLYFHLSPEKGVLGDNNTQLIEMYGVIRDCPDKLARRLVHIPRTADAYYRWRSIRPDTLDRETRALRFLFLNRHCFNGIYRTNDLGQFNVPFGTRLGDALTPATIRECARRLLKARLITGDFEKTIDCVAQHDLVYMDPPFAAAKNRNRRQYGAAAFLPADIFRLDDAMREVVRRGADFVVSYGDCREARWLANRWNACRVRVRRHVAGFSGNRRHAFEWLVTNN